MTSPTLLSLAGRVEAQRFDWYAEFCREKFGMSADWDVYSWAVKNHQKPGEFILVEGAVCKEQYTKGKRKGRINYQKCEAGTRATLSIRSDELEQFKLDWSLRTGYCATCYGTGQQWYGWSAEHGTKYRDCIKCEATGRARSALEASHE